jgi:hypothetical protein
MGGSLYLLEISREGFLAAYRPELALNMPPSSRRGRELGFSLQSRSIVHRTGFSDPATRITFHRPRRSNQGDWLSQLPHGAEAPLRLARETGSYPHQSQAGPLAWAAAPTLRLAL